MVQNSLIINPKRKILLSNSFGENEADDIVGQLFELGRDIEQSIYLQINSKGGSYVGGMKVYDTILNNAVPVTGIVTGDAFSMAAVILQACNHRAATKHSRILFHNVYWDFSLKIQPNSKVDDFKEKLQEEIDEVIRKNETIKTILTGKLPADFGDLDGFLKAERALPASRALLLNLLDEII